MNTNPLDARLRRLRAATRMRGEHLSEAFGSQELVLTMMQLAGKTRT